MKAADGYVQKDTYTSRVWDDQEGASLARAAQITS